MRAINVYHYYYYYYVGLVSAGKVSCCGENCRLAAFIDLTCIRYPSCNIYFFCPKMGSLISEVSSRQVKAEKERLEQAKYIAETEKNLYVKVFQK